MKIKNVYLNHKSITPYITVIYEDENEACIMEHKISAPLNISDTPSIGIDVSEYGEAICSVDLGFGNLANATVDSRTIKTKVKEMTVEDIEKELGYKVKIVGGNQ